MSTSSVRAPIDVQGRSPRPAGTSARPTGGLAAGPRRVLLLGGPLTVVLYVAAMMLAGEAPAIDAGTAELTAYWADETNVLVAFLVFTAAMVFAAFAAGLAGVLREHGDDGPLPLLAAVGGGVASVGLTLSAMLAISLQDAADEVGGAPVGTLNLMMDNLWMPIVAGFGLVLAATGFSARRTRALPGALAWAAIVLGLVAPLYYGGFATYMLGGVWFAVTGIVLSRRRAG